MMLEDLNSIDIILHEPGQWVKFVIIDSGKTKQSDPDRHLELLNHKIGSCIAMIEDDEKFDQLGRPEDIAIEVRCAYTVQNNTPIHRSIAFTSGRVMNYIVSFVHYPSPYG